MFSILFIAFRLMVNGFRFLQQLSFLLFGEKKSFLEEKKKSFLRYRETGREFRNLLLVVESLSSGV